MIHPRVMDRTAVNEGDEILYYYNYSKKSSRKSNAQE